MSNQNQKPQGLPNPYATGGLPNPYALPTVAAAAPVHYSEEQAKAAEAKKTTAKLFQPLHIKRPQAKVTNAVKKPQLPKVTMPPSSTKNVPTEMPQQRSYEYYLSTADDDSAQIEANREWRREENRKKKEDKKFYKKYGNWRPNEPYKMRYPTNIAAFKAMDGWQKKDEQFRDFLKTARRKAQAKNDSDEVRDTHAVAQSGSHSPSVAADPMFAPPSWDQDKSSDPSTPSRAVEESHVPEKANVLPAPSVVPPPNDEPTTVAPVVSAASVAQSAQEAFALRVELAKQLAASVKKPSQSPPPPPPPPSDGAPAFLDGATPPPPPAYNPTISAPPVRYNPTISAEPVHYARPSAPATRGIGNDDDESQGRPKKKQKTVEPPKPSKAALMMAKMGYKKGQGLGKNNDGAIVALEVKARKDNSSRPMRDEFDEDGGKIIKSQQVFDILGGHRKEKHEAGPFGEPSCVIVTWGCVDGVDWALDADRNDGGIRQEMGDAFNTKFGAVERIHVNMATDNARIPVYIHFKDPLCALNAVNRFHEGYPFQDRTIKAVFYDETKFSNLTYEH